MKTSSALESALLEYSKKGIIIPRIENNSYLKVSYKGADKLVSSKWNVKIYTSGSVVCNDFKVLQDILSGTLKTPDNSLKIIQLDDSGWGFPLCGTMIGITDSKQVWTDVVDVYFFQGDNFEKKIYLEEYAQKGLKLIQALGISPSSHRIEICTGYINTKLKDILREKGFDVRVTEIKGLLQDKLEDLFKEHVKQMTGKDLAYDVKEMDRSKIGSTYYSVLNWGKKNAPHLLKNGWSSMKCS